MASELVRICAGAFSAFTWLSGLAPIRRLSAGRGYGCCMASRYPRRALDVASGVPAGSPAVASRHVEFRARARSIGLRSCVAPGPRHHRADIVCVSCVEEAAVAQPHIGTLLAQRHVLRCPGPRPGDAAAWGCGTYETCIVHLLIRNAQSRACSLSAASDRTSMQPAPQATSLEMDSPKGGSHACEFASKCSF